MAALKGTFRNPQLGANIQYGIGVSQLFQYSCSETTKAKWTNPR